MGPCEVSESEEDEEEAEDSSNLSKAAQPRGRVRKRKEKARDDDSEMEEEDPDSIELADDGEEDIDEINMPENEWSDLNEEVEQDSHRFDASPQGGIQRSLKYYVGFTPYRLFTHLFMKIIEWTVKCTNKYIQEQEEFMRPILCGELMVFIAIYLFMGINRLPSVKLY